MPSSALSTTRSNWCWRYGEANSYFVSVAEAEPVLHGALPELLPQLHGRLEAMFGDRGLERLRERSPNHPAVRRFDQIEELRREHGTLRGAETTLVLDVLREWLDTWSWARGADDSDFWKLVPRDGTRERIVRTLSNEEQYEDCIAELFFWGWLREQGFAVEHLDDAGIADLSIAQGGQSVPADVKRIHVGTGPRRVAKVITKANKQIKASGSGAGVVFIWLGLPMLPTAGDDQAPREVQQYIDAAKAALAGANSSVGQAVIVWDEFIVMDEPALAAGDSRLIGICARRDAVVIEHPNPSSAPLIASSQLQIGMTGIFMIGFRRGEHPHQTPDDLRRVLKSSVLDEPEFDGSSVSLHEQLRSAPDDVRPRANHILKAFREPSGVAVLDLGGIRIALVTRRVMSRNQSFVLVVHAVAGSDSWTVDGGYRLYGTDVDVARWAAEPTEAFAEVLVRFGMRYQLGMSRAWWLPYVELELPADLPLVDVAATTAGRVGVLTTPGSSVACGMMISPTPGIVVSAGLHWINVDRYRSELIRLSRRR